jgi:hypothetical protein
LKASRIDSLYKDVKDDEAELWMVSVLRGAAWSTGAMEGTMVAVEFFSCFVCS